MTPPGSELRVTLRALLSGRPGQTARELAQGANTPAARVDKRTVNAMLYRHPDVFRNDGALPPRWSLIESRAAAYERTPHKVAAVGLNNWKAFSEADVSFGGITLLFGDNSSGKSSILQGLLLLKQSWGSSDLQFEGPFGSFGWYQHVVHGHDPARKLSLHAIWGGGEGADWSVSVDAHVSEKYAFHHRHPIDAFRCVAGDDGILLASTEFRDVADDSLKDAWVVVRTTASSAPGADPEALVTGGHVVVVGKDSDGFPDLKQIRSCERGVDGQPTVTVLETLEVVEAVLAGATRMLGSIEHIRPFRSIPDRDITLSEVREGADYIARLFEDEGRELLPDVNDWLAAFEVPYTIDIERYGGEGEDQSFALNLTRLGGAGEKVHLRDVGFGVGQLLPIIVRLLGSQEKTILIEEPEAHIHPRLHSVMADLFVTSMQDYGNALVVETHSEAMLLRLQRRVAEGRIRSDEVFVHHVLRGGDSAQVLPVEIRENGTLDYEWPGGFFDNRMDDLVAILDPRPDE